jgi:hypothetical protein
VIGYFRRRRGDAAVPNRAPGADVTAATAICAASMLALGGWAFLAPTSFAAFVGYAPYNQHLIHDAGAFQLGIGTAALLALSCADGLLVALAGFVAAAGLHTLSHVIDRHLGGHAWDVPALGLLTLVGVYALSAMITRRTS